MKRLPIFIVVALIVTILAACASGPGAPVQTGQPTNPPASPTETPVPPTPVETEAPLPEAAVAARQALADMLKIDPGQITVANITQQDFSDSCLGLGGPAESCLQVITPGYAVEMTAGDMSYTFHASTDGSVVRLAKPEAVRAATQALAALLGIGTNEITINQITQKDFKDGCLEIHEPGVMCTDVIVPGYVVDMTAAGTRYVYHSNMDGTVVKMEQTGPSTGLPVQGQDPIVKAAIEFLASQLQISNETIMLVSKDAVDWPDACLGIHEPGVGCATVITPGYKIVLEYNGKQYVIHTDLTGTNIALEKPSSD